MRSAASRQGGIERAPSVIDRLISVLMVNEIQNRLQAHGLSELTEKERQSAVEFAAKVGFEVTAIVGTCIITLLPPTKTDRSGKSAIMQTAESRRKNS